MSLVEEFRKCWLIAIIGCILFTSGTGILFWNEGRAVNTIISLDEALDNCVTINPEEEFENNIYEGRIVHIAGPILLGEPLTEPDYNIQILAVKLKRRVQMFQWIEESVEHTYGESIRVRSDDKTYYYTTDWKDKLIDSRRFYLQTNHQNPDKFPIENLIQVADTVTIGKFELSNAVKDKFTKFIELTSDSRPEDPTVKLHLGLYYHSNDLFNPEIGDIRILFSFAGMEGESYTVVGKIEKGKIIPYQTSRNTDILLVYPGEMSLTDVFKSEHHAQRFITWGYRFFGWVLLFFGATCSASLLHIILSRIYFLSSLAPDPQFPVSANIILSFSLALLITSVAWFFHRPLFGAGLLFAAASPFIYCATSVAQYQKIN